MSAANPWADLEREEGTIERVEPEHKGWFSVTSSNGWSCGVSAEYGVEPKVGDAFITWGSIGRPIRGQAINGRVLYYRTPDEQNVEDAKQAEAMRSERIASYESKRAEFDARVAALPNVFRERVESFRAFRGDAWRWEFEPYELMVCEQAAKLVERFQNVESLVHFSKLEYDDQKVAFPEMDTGHSGNSWGQVLRLARCAIERPELVPQMHGALCPLVGCESYGCYAVREGVER